MKDLKVFDFGQTESVKQVTPEMVRGNQAIELMNSLFFYPRILNKFWRVTETPKHTITVSGIRSFMSTGRVLNLNSYIRSGDKTNQSSNKFISIVNNVTSSNVTTVNDALDAMAEWFEVDRELIDNIMGSLQEVLDTIDKLCKVHKELSEHRVDRKRLIKRYDKLSLSYTNLLNKYFGYIFKAFNTLTDSASIDYHIKYNNQNPLDFSTFQQDLKSYYTLDKYYNLNYQDIKDTKPYVIRELKKYFYTKAVKKEK